MTDDGDGVTWVGTLRVQIVDTRKESPGSQTSGGAGSVVPGRSETFVSYGVRAETDLPHFARTYMVTRKRFQDFAFLRNALVQDFPACIVPPLPDKHRLGTCGSVAMALTQATSRATASVPSLFSGGVLSCSCFLSACAGTRRCSAPRLCSSSSSRLSGTSTCTRTRGSLLSRRTRRPVGRRLHHRVCLSR